MQRYSTIVKKFDERGEKTGWTYIEVPDAVAQKLKPGNKKSFRVKGKLNDFLFEQVALIPMGEGLFIMALKADVRKVARLKKGDMVNVQMSVDDKIFELSPELMECLSDEPKALTQFNKQPKSHQRYFNNWLIAAKTDVTKAKRIAQIVTAMLKGQDFGEMVRSLKKDKDELTGR